MLLNIFLFKGKIIRDLEDLNIFSYPNEIISIDDKILVNKIIKGHDDDDCCSKAISNQVKIAEPIAQTSAPQRPAIHFQYVSASAVAPVVPFDETPKNGNKSGNKDHLNGTDPVLIYAVEQLLASPAAGAPQNEVLVGALKRRSS